MGQAGSHKRDGKKEYLDGKAVRLLHGMTDLGEPPVESYDKLVAWLAEMAERDNMELDTNLFLRQIRRLYNHSRKTYLSLPSRQNSGASNESNASSGGECSSAGVTRSPHLSCANLGLYTRPVLNRQRHVMRDDQEDSLTAEDTTNASIESLYNDSDRDIDTISLSLDESGWSGKKRDDLSQSMYLIAYETRSFNKTYSASVGNLLNLSHVMPNTNIVDQKSHSVLDLPNDDFSQEPRQSVPEIREIPPREDSVSERCVLEQSFLDDNMEDILFSVEALWPVK